MAATTSTPSTSARPTGYDTDIRFFANRYKQGGRTVYALNLSPAQVISTIKRPDPSQASPGNRAIKLSHAQGFAKYFREHESWVVPGMILRTSSTFEFEAIEEVDGIQFGLLTIPRLSTDDIHILDGQHRILGFYLAKEGISQDLDKARSQLAAARKMDGAGSAGEREAQRRIAALETQRKRFESERVDLTIVVEPDPAAYKQMFFDIADNAKGISASVKTRFDARKVVNRSLESVMAHPLLANRVDIEADRIGRGSTYLMGARHVGEIIKNVMVGLEGRVSRKQDIEAKESEVSQEATDFLDVMTEAFPPLRAVTIGQLLPDDLRNTSLLGSILMLRTLAGVHHTLKKHAFSNKMVQDYFSQLAPHMEAPVYPGSIWMEHTEGIFDDGARSPHSRRQDLRQLHDSMVTWAIEKPEWLSAPPAPRPKFEDELDFEVSDERADEILRPETAKARAKAKAKSDDKA